jgi:hypothetical protein
MHTDRICDSLTVSARNIELVPGAVFDSERGQNAIAPPASHLVKHILVGSMAAPAFGGVALFS